MKPCHSTSASCSGYDHLLLFALENTALSLLSLSEGFTELINSDLLSGQRNESSVFLVLLFVLDLVLVLPLPLSHQTGAKRNLTHYSELQ